MKFEDAVEAMLDEQLTDTLLDMDDLSVWSYTEPDPPQDDLEGPVDVVRVFTRIGYDTYRFEVTDVGYMNDALLLASTIETHIQNLIETIWDNELADKLGSDIE